MRAKGAHHARKGFTLIEMSIVLVVIGLIAGGVLVGQSLIGAAAVRAQVTQIEKFNTAASTFVGKYGYLPGDIKNPEASNFGFQPRGQYAGEGDGNGVLEGIYSNTPNDNSGFNQTGENLMFWVDLSTAHLIDGNFNTATPLPTGSVITGQALAALLPAAKIGNSNYLFTFSGGWSGGVHGQGNGKNYFGLETVTSIGQAGCTACLYSDAGLTVQQAYSIDMKVDDGNPTSGNVLAALISSNNFYWGNTISGGGGNVAPPTIAITGSSTTCFDNAGVSGGPQQYSVEVSSGSNVTCALNVRIQAGD